MGAGGEGRADDQPDAGLRDEHIDFAIKDGVPPYASIS